MQDELEEVCCRRMQWVIFWFETVQVVSAVALPPNLGIRVRTSCSAGRSAGLDPFASGFIQMKVGMYYRNQNIEREGISEE